MHKIIIDVVIFLVSHKLYTFYQSFACDYSAARGSGGGDGSSTRRIRHFIDEWSTDLFFSHEKQLRADTIHETWPDDFMM